MSLSHILCGAFGFLLGSAGVAEGSRKRNPVVFGAGLCFLLAGAAAFFMALVNRAIDEAEDEYEDEEAEVIAADAAEKAKAVAEQAAEVAEKAAEAAEKAEAVAEKVAEAAEKAAAAIEEAAEEADAAEKAEDAE